VELRPFDARAASQVSSWASSADEVWAWCSRRDAPVPAEEIVRWSSAADVEAYTLGQGDEIIAYGELWLDDEEMEVELARLIVAPAHRGRGFGRELVTALTDLAHRRQPLAVLRVHPHNTAARRCYAAAGFERVSPVDEAEWNAHEPIAYVWMMNRAQDSPGARSET
jgi:RimJ/RimL family protein N-acetyltransferase